MTTFAINAQKNAPRDTNNDKQRRNKMQNIRTQTDEKDGDKQASTFEERYQELEEKIKQKAAAAKSDLKQHEKWKNRSEDES